VSCVVSADRLWAGYCFPKKKILVKKIRRKSGKLYKNTLVLVKFSILTYSQHKNRWNLMSLTAWCLAKVRPMRASLRLEAQKTELFTECLAEAKSNNSS
jgi:hypothetical protein